MDSRKVSVQVSPKTTVHLSDAQSPDDGSASHHHKGREGSQSGSGSSSGCGSGSDKYASSKSGRTSSGSSDGKSDEDKDRPSLDFAKREVSSSQARSSYSQLSSIANSPERVHIPADPTTDEPVLQADDQERIRNPVSAAFRKSPVGEEIGYRQPFGNDVATNDKQNRSSYTSPVSSSTTAQSSANTSPLGSASKSASDVLTFGRAPSMRRTRRYKPARVVLHKSDSGIGVNLKGGDGSSGYFDSSTYTPNSASSSQIPENPPRRVSDSQIVSPTLVSSLASSPEDRQGAPLKYIREPKQPMYIPAVLRPTDFANYSNGVQQQVNFQTPSRRRLTTQHWMRDATSDSCAKCHEPFTWFRRRHHCRKCGGIFCAKDSNHVIGLDRVLNFNILGIPCRACDACADDFAAFCLEVPRLQDVNTSTQQPMPATEPEEIEVGGGGDWSTF